MNWLKFGLFPVNETPPEIPEKFWAKVGLTKLEPIL